MCLQGIAVPCSDSPPYHYGILLEVNGLAGVEYMKTKQKYLTKVYCNISVFNEETENTALRNSSCSILQISSIT